MPNSGDDDGYVATWHTPCKSRRVLFSGVPSSIQMIPFEYTHDFKNFYFK